jgi:GTPase SAR1 family protein
MLSTYMESKRQLQSLVNSAREATISEAFFGALASGTEQLQNEMFTLVVIGQFKRGKTTLINALLGEDLLPTAIIPLTSIITILYYGDEPRLTVFFASGTSQVISRDDLASYVTEEANPKNEKGVERVEIAYPSAYLKSGLRIVDTPGIASVHGHNTKTTYDYLPEADAAIFMLSADLPITEAELRFLHDIKGSLAKIVFVQNKIDTVSAQELEASLAFTKRVVEEAMGAQQLIFYPLSARQALEAKEASDSAKLQSNGFASFETALEQFLAREKGDVLIRSVARKLTAAAERERLSATITAQAMADSTEEINRKERAFVAGAKDVEQERLDITRLLKAELQALLQTFTDRDLASFQKTQTRELLREVESIHEKNQNTGSRKLANIFEEQITVAIRSAFADWLSVQEKEVHGELKEICHRFTERMRQLTTRIVALSDNLFHLETKSLVLDEPYLAKITLSFAVDQDVGPFTMLVNFLIHLLPTFISRQILMSQARQAAVQYVDQQCGRLRYELSQRVQTAGAAYERSLNGQLEEVQQTIVRALETARALKPSVIERTSALQESFLRKKAFLEEFGSKLQDIQRLPL